MKPSRHTGTRSFNIANFEGLMVNARAPITGSWAVPELIVWHSNICFAIWGFDDLIDGYNFSLLTIQEASTELVSPGSGCIGTIGSAIITRVGTRRQILNINLPKQATSCTCMLCCTCGQYVRSLFYLVYLAWYYMPWTQITEDSRLEYLKTSESTLQTCVL